MAVSKEMVSHWLEWLAEWVEGANNIGEIDGLVRAYALAAEKTGFERELVDRIAAIPSMEPRYGPAAVRELRSVAAETRRQTSGDPLRSAAE